MKRITVLILVGILLAANASAQVRFGLRGGINTAYFSAKDVITDNYIIETVNDASIGFHGGLMMQISFFGLFLQPELLFSSIGSELKVRDLSQPGVISHIREQNFTKLDFPVLLGKRFGPARVGIGPVGTIMLSTKSKLNEFGLEEKFNSATFGYQIGAGLDILKTIALDLKYEGNLSRLGNSITAAGREWEFDSRSRQIIVSVGIMF